jgi:hypothetical protein
MANLNPAPINENLAQPMPSSWALWFNQVTTFINSLKALFAALASGQVIYSTGTTLAAAPNMRYDAAAGVTQLGTATDYTEFQADGSLKMVGAATVWTAMDAGLIPPHGTSATPAVIKFNGDSILDCYAFSGTNPTPDVYSSMAEMPRGYKDGADVHLHVQWFPTTTNVGNVKWQLRYVMFNHGGVVPGPAQTVSIVQTTPGVAWQEQTAIFDILGTGMTLGARLIYYLFRDATDVQDTYAFNAGVTGIGIHTEIDQIGSRQHEVK